MAKIFVIIGKSATGKDTLFRRVIKDSGLPLKTVVSYTTRPIRYGEVDGREYFFVDTAKLKALTEQGKVIEHRVYQTIQGPWHYFTANDGQIDLDQADYLLIMTLEGFEQIRNYYGHNRVIPIYIEVNDRERLRRAMNRERKQEHPRYAELCRRYLADEADFSEENIRRLGIVKRYCNEKDDRCYRQVIKTIRRMLRIS